jgi:hypothetical protein
MQVKGGWLIPIEEEYFLQGIGCSITWSRLWRAGRTDLIQLIEHDDESGNPGERAEAEFIRHQITKLVPQGGYVIERPTVNASVKLSSRVQIDKCYLLFEEYTEILVDLEKRGIKPFYDFWIEP